MRVVIAQLVLSCSLLLGLLMASGSVVAPRARAVFQDEARALPASFSSEAAAHAPEAPPVDDPEQDGEDELGDEASDGHAAWPAGERPWPDPWALAGRTSARHDGPATALRTRPGDAPESPPPRA